MEKVPMIFGHELEPEDRGEVREGLERFAEEGLKEIEGEIEKKDEMLDFLELVGGEFGYLNTELRSMQLHGYGMDVRRIHILPSNIFEKEFDWAESNGKYWPLGDGIYLRADMFRLQLYKSLLHEMVHQASFRSFYADKYIYNVRSLRTGYAVEHPTEGEHEHFRGLNEAIVDRITRDIIRRHADELGEALHISDEESQQPVSYYIEEMDVLDVVINKIAEHNGETPEEVWQRFKKGEFTGKMMHLREVEKVFGKGALRVLAAMGSGLKDNGAEGIEKVLAYFNAESEKEKDRIAKEILIERERMRYIKRKEKPREKPSPNFFGSPSK